MAKSSISFNAVDKSQLSEYPMEALNGGKDLTRSRAMLIKNEQEQEQV